MGFKCPLCGGDFPGGPEAIKDHVPNCASKRLLATERLRTVAVLERGTAIAPFVLNTRETSVFEKIKQRIDLDREMAQREADIWMRSAATKNQLANRKKAVASIGLGDEIQFL